MTEIVIEWDITYDSILNSLIIMTTLIYKIPPNLPLPKGGMVRQAHHDICHPEPVEGCQRGVRGDFM